MKISGFSFARNADRLGYPVAESIRSILPVCDEFVIAIGKGDKGDRTRQLVAAVGSPKVRIIDTEWPENNTLGSGIYARQTNIALDACTGDWCFYIQADEAVHEQYLDTIRKRCKELLAVTTVEGLLFSYRHFWGDYQHLQDGHKWYPREIRIVRNGIGARSIGDAQSFRRNGKKLTVALANAEVFHYGYVRDPRLMRRRNIAVETIYAGAGPVKKRPEEKSDVYDFGPLNRRTIFSGTHPAVMQERIRSMDWGGLLQAGGKPTTIHHHDRFKSRFLTFLEKTFFGGRQIGGYKNYVLKKNV
jgi:hypothetical protein